MPHFKHFFLLVCFLFLKGAVAQQTGTTTPLDTRCSAYTSCGRCTYQSCGWCDATKSCLSRLSKSRCPSQPKTPNWILPGQQCTNTIIHVTYNTSSSQPYCGSSFGETYIPPATFYAFQIPPDVGTLVSFHVNITSTAIVNPIVSNWEFDTIYVGIRTTRKQCPWFDALYSWQLSDPEKFPITNDSTAWSESWKWDSKAVDVPKDKQLLTGLRESQALIFEANCMNQVQLEFKMEYTPKRLLAGEWENPCVNRPPKGRTFEVDIGEIALGETNSSASSSSTTLLVAIIVPIVVSVILLTIIATAVFIRRRGRDHIKTANHMATNQQQTEMTE